MANIMDLTVRELMLLNKLTRLAEESTEASEAIHRNFRNSFSLNTKRIHVYHTESCGEYYGDGYLTIDGVFEYCDNWWGGRSWEVPCSADEIYQVFRAKYLVDNNMESRIPVEERKLADVAHYLRDFVSTIKEKKEEYL